MNTPDHLMWAASSLDEGVALMRRLTGVEAGVGGPHPGNGTRNALMSLGATCYLEIIAPDPAQDQTGTMGAQFARLAAPLLNTFAVRTTDIRRAHAQATAAGLTVTGPRPLSRRHPDGRLLEWQLMYLDGGHPYGRLMPFFIDWGATRHPAEDSVKGLTLADFVVFHPEPAPLRRLYEQLEIAVTVAAGASPGLYARLDGPAGPAVLTGFPPL